MQVGVEVGGCSKPRAEEACEDELVALEKQHLSSGQAALDAISLQHVRKVYQGHPPKVHNLAEAVYAFDAATCANFSCALKPTKAPAFRDLLLVLVNKAS